MRVRPVEVSRARGQVLRRRHVLVKKLVLMIGRPLKFGALGGGLDELAKFMRVAISAM